MTSDNPTNALLIELELTRHIFRQANLCVYEHLRKKFPAIIDILEEQFEQRARRLRAIFDNLKIRLTSPASQPSRQPPKSLGKVLRKELSSVATLLKKTGFTEDKDVGWTRLDIHLARIDRMARRTTDKTPDVTVVMVDVLNDFNARDRKRIVDDALANFYDGWDCRGRT